MFHLAKGSPYRIPLLQLSAGDEKQFVYHLQVLRHDERKFCHFGNSTQPQQCKFFSQYQVKTLLSALEISLSIFFPLASRFSFVGAENIQRMCVYAVRYGSGCDGGTYVSGM